MTRALVLVMLATALAAADPVTLKVTEVAGGIAYLAPGRAAGVTPGTKIRIRGHDYVVIDVTEKTCAVRGALAVGDTGSANVKRGATTTAEKLPPPHPAEAFAGQWPDPVLPATTQHPEPVPLGSGRARGQSHVTVLGHAYAVAGRGGKTADAEARVIASFDVLADRPLAGDLDVAGRWFGGVDTRARVPVFVRTAQLRYGTAADPRLALGRLRWAASSLGMLDGGRASARMGALELAAFGGLVPDPVSGKPTTSASRFGGELVYDDATAAWQPRIGITASGSTWMGQLDERRLSFVASAGHAATWLDAWAEAQMFSAGNPWNAKPIELTGAGATAEWREHGYHVGLDVTYLRPERSLRLAAALPPEWLCTLALAGTSCVGGDYWTAATASAGARGASWALDAVGSVGRSHTEVRGGDASGYIRGEVRAGPGRLVAGASAGVASFATWMSAEGGVGIAPSRRFDAEVRYRPELLEYTAATGGYVLHSIIGDVRYAATTALDVALDAIATTGADRDALAILTTIAWRPLP